MSSVRNRSDALTRALDDARGSQPAEMDWTKVEARLLSQLEREPARERSLRPWLGAAAALAGIAAAVALVFGAPSETGVPSAGLARHARSPVTVAPVNVAGEALLVGKRFVAGPEGMLVRQPGLVAWRLAPESSAEIKALEPAVVVQLQSGRLHAEVVPSARPESFVVEVGALRVAVHGTVFSVLREGDDAIVEVREGTVAVGKTGQPATVLLKGPASARFKASGAGTGQYKNQRGRVIDLRKRGAPVASASSDAPPDVAPELQNQPTFDEVEEGLAETEAVLKKCLAQHVSQGHAVKFSLKTRATMFVTPSGELGEYRFQPPLNPAMSGCVQEGLLGVRFAPSASGAHVIRDLEIAR